MRAMVLDRPRTALVMRERPMPVPGPGELLVAVAARVFHGGIDA